jgi:predicted PurR-regulated permease PerM
MDNASRDASPTSFQRRSFLLYLLAVSAAFFYVVRAFIMPVLLAAVFSALTYPVYEGFLHRVKKPAIAALLTLVSLLLVLVLPLIAIGTLAYQEAVGFFGHVNLDQWRARLESFAQGLHDRFPTLFQRMNPGNLTHMAIGQLQNAAQFGIKHGADISLSVANNLLSFFLMLFIMFYFYIDGTRILERIIRWSPLKDEYERILIEKFVSVSKGTLKGILVIGIIQGILGGILFAFMRFTSPVFMGVLMVFASIIPAVGTAAVWAPAAVVLLVEGRWAAAIITAGFGAFVIGSVDNFVRPVLVGKDIKMHDLLVLLSTLGGLGIFGLPGLILGPIVAALFLAIWNIYEEVFAEELAANRQSGARTRKIAQIMKTDAPPATQSGPKGPKKA